MKKGTKIFFIAIAFIVIVAGVLTYSLTKKSGTVTPATDVILFYGRECPHCQDVEKFLSDNNIAQKVKYDSIEVWHNEDNANLMKEKAKECGLDQSKIGVPLVYGGGKCYVGTPDVEAFFKQQIGL
jgi:glutaredoxin